MTEPQLEHSKRGLLVPFLIVDALGFVILSITAIAFGVAEAIPFMVAVYFLGFQTGGEV